MLFSHSSNVLISFELQEHVRVAGAEGIVARTQQANGKYFSGVYFNGIDDIIASKIDRYVETILFVRGMKPFTKFKDEEVWSLRRASEEVAFKKGEFFFKEGGPSGEFFMVESGRVELLKKASEKKEFCLRGPARVISSVKWRCLIPENARQPPEL